MTPTAGSVLVLDPGQVSSPETTARLCLNHGLKEENISNISSCQTV